MADTRLFWLDLETTGLEPGKADILEVGVIITDPYLNELASYHALVEPRHNFMDYMDDYCFRMHTDNGLLGEIEKGAHKLSSVEHDLEDFIRTNVLDVNYIAGSSIHFDVRFLKHYMPSIFKVPKLSYRLLDVSSLKIAYELQGWPSPPRSKVAHRTLDDCRGSIEEYRFYMQRIKDYGDMR
jgi:oligoribonuclease